MYTQNNVIVVCKEGLYESGVKEMVLALKTIPGNLKKEDMKQHMEFIKNTSNSLVIKCEQELRSTMDKITLQEKKLEDLRNEYINIEDDNTIIDRIMAQVGNYTDCRMLKASIRRRKNLNKMLSEDEVLTLSMQKDKLEVIEGKLNAAKEVVMWANDQMKDESQIIEIE